MAKWWWSLKARIRAIYGKSVPLLFALVALSVIVLAFSEYPAFRGWAQTPTNSISSQSSTKNRRSAQLSAAPATINFGQLNVSSIRELSKNFKITDHGNAPLIVNVGNAVGAGFSVTSGGGQSTIVPGQDLTVAILFNPSSGGEGQNGKVPSRFGGSVPITATAGSGATLRGASSKEVHLLGKAIGTVPANPVPTMLALRNSMARRNSRCFKAVNSLSF